jgi:hypothetical protein
VDVVAAVGADEQPAAVVDPREAALDDPAVSSEAGSVPGLTASDHGLDPAPPEQATVLVVVVAAIGEQALGSSAWAADATAHRWHPVEQLEQLGDVVAVPRCQRPGKRDPAALYEKMVLAPAPAAVNRARTRLRAPFFACT